MRKKSTKVLVLALIAAMLIFIPVLGNPQSAEAATIISPKVATHTQREISNYFKSKGIDFDETTTFTTKPAPSNTIGAISDKSQKSALKTLNYIRFVAGINDNVQTDAKYIKNAQAAAFISNLNNDLEHKNPLQPKGMTKTTYDLCREGTKKSNLYWSDIFASANYKFSLNNTLISYLSENGTISKENPTGSIGHRMYVLNPKLGKTGFGVSHIENYNPASAMYALESSNTSPSGQYVVWPAQQTPINLFSDNWASTKQWSVSSFTQKVDINKVNVKIVRQDDKKTWVINKNNTSQGTLEYKDCTGISHIDSYIKFNPKDLNPEVGDRYDVEITNLGSDTLKYTVKFFDVNDPEGDIEATSVKIDKTKINLKAGTAQKLTATVFPSNADNKVVTWTSSNTSVATVDSSGNVKGIKRGKAIITAKTSNEKIASCEVQVLFDDVQDSTKYFYTPVYWALNSGVTNGSTGNNFSPNGTATREQAVTLIYNYAGKPKVNKTTVLKDISDCSSYAVNAVKWAKERKLTTREDNKFFPKNASTRGEMVTFLWRLAGSPKPTIKNPFTDLNQKQYYYNAVIWAKEKKVTTASGKFNPDGKLSRAEAVTFIYNYYKNVNKK